MNRKEADELGLKISTEFVNAYASLLKAGYYDNARGLVLCTYPFVIAQLSPPMRVLALADLIEIYHNIGKEIYEDGADLYDALTKRGGPSE
jgi:hypothetical protein